MAIVRFDQYYKDKSNVINVGILKHVLATEFYNILFNSFTIEPTIADFSFKYRDERFVKKALIKLNRVGYDKITKKFYYVDGEGIDNEGYPTKLIFTTANGKIFRRLAYYDDNEEGAYCLYCLPSNMPFITILNKYVDDIVETEISIKQNLKATRTAKIVYTNSKNNALSIKQAMNKKEEGASFIVLNGELKEGMSAIDVGVEFLATELYDLKQKMVNDFLSKIGILTTEFKKERVQSAEINGSIDKVIDYTNLFINGFNRQCKDYAIPLIAKIQGAIDKLYTDELDTNIKDTDILNGDENE